MLGFDQYSIPTGANEYSCLPTVKGLDDEFHINPVRNVTVQSGVGRLWRSQMRHIYIPTCHSLCWHWTHEHAKSFHKCDTKQHHSVSFPNIKKSEIYFL